MRKKMGKNEANKKNITQFNIKFIIYIKKKT